MLKLQPATHDSQSLFWTLLRFRGRAVRNHLHTVGRESRFRVIVVAVLGVIFWGGLFALFLNGFQFIKDNAGFFQSFLIHYGLSLFFLALTFMLVFSNAVISFSNLFKSPETAFLFSIPMRRDTIYIYKLLESVIFSSWALFALGIPFLLAYGLKAHAPWFFYPIALAFLVPFVLLPAAMGGLVAMLLTAIVPRHRATVLGVVTVCVIGIGLYLGLTLMSIEGAHSTAGMEASIKAVLGRLSFTQYYLTPNYWVTEGLLSISEGRADATRAVLIFFCALTSSALFFSVLGWFLSGALYATTYSRASGLSNASRVAKRSRLERLLERWLVRYPEIGILLIKDVKTFLRDPVQWSQVFIFFGILILYVGNLRNFAYPLDQPFYQNLISFLNLGATCMTLATVTSRFIFPLISLEGRRFWVLGLVPLQRRHIVWSKFFFAFGGSALLSTVLVLLSNCILSSPGWVLLVQLFTGLMVSAGLSGLSVGMGALFPNFNERNPSKIVSGFGGTLNLILSVGLVLFTIGAEGLICHRYLVWHMVNDVSVGTVQFSWLLGLLIVFVALLNLSAAYLPMRAGIRALERVEF